MLDHAGDTSYDGSIDTPLQLAALARELAANDLNERASDRLGTPGGRNVELLVRAPTFLGRR